MSKNRDYVYARLVVTEMLHKPARVLADIIGEVHEEMVTPKDLELAIEKALHSQTRLLIGIMLTLHAITIVIVLALINAKLP